MVASSWQRAPPVGDLHALTSAIHDSKPNVRHPANSYVQVLSARGNHVRIGLQWPINAVASEPPSLNDTTYWAGGPIEPQGTRSAYRQAQLRRPTLEYLSQAYTSCHHFLPHCCKESSRGKANNAE